MVDIPAYPGHIIFLRPGMGAVRAWKLARKYYQAVALHAVVEALAALGFDLVHASEVARKDRPRYLARLVIMRKHYYVRKVV